MAEIEGLVRALREGDDAAKTAAARELGDLAFHDAANRVLIAEAGGIPPLVQLVHDGSADAKWSAAWALRNLADNNDANAVAIAAAVGLDALVELARRGSVTVDNRSAVLGAGVPAKRKAALVVAALLGATACAYVAPTPQRTRPALRASARSAPHRDPGLAHIPTPEARRGACHRRGHTRELPSVPEGACPAVLRSPSERTRALCRATPSPRPPA